MAVEHVLERGPVEMLPTRATIQPLAPEPPDQPIEAPQTAGVRRPTVVLVVTSKFGVERRRLILDWVVPMLAAPLRHRLHTAPKALAHRPDVNRELSPAATRRTMPEPEGVEGRRLWRARIAR